MRKIFILEDMKERHEAFRRKFPNDELTIVETVDEAINILSKDLEWSLMFLDHDLGLRAYMDICDNNVGTVVARFLRDKDIKCPIIIHSLNWYGAMNMKSYIPKAYYCPGIWLKDEYPGFLEKLLNDIF